MRRERVSKQFNGAETEKGYKVSGWIFKWKWESNCERLRSLDFILGERGFELLKTEAVSLLKIVNLMARCGKILMSRKLL